MKNQDQLTDQLIIVTTFSFSHFFSLLLLAHNVFPDVVA